MQKKEIKSGSLVFIIFLVAILSVSFASAGWTDVLKQFFGIGDSDLSGELATVSPTHPSYTCIETDNGIDYYAKGSTSGILRGTSSDYVTYYDACLAGRTTYYVKEYYCSDNQVYSTTYACEDCQDGACVEETYECYSDSDCDYMDTECAEGICQGGYCNQSYSSLTKICRASAGECDEIEYCTGYSPYCSIDLNKSEGTHCSGGECQNGVCVWVSQDTTPPSISMQSLGGDTTSPYSTFDSTPLVIVSTNEKATCRASTDGDESYSQMSDDIQCNSVNLTHVCQLLLISDSSYNRIYVSCKDNAGNENTQTNNLNEYYSVDTQPPIQTSHRPQSGSAINTPTITIEVGTNEKATCRASTDGDESYSQMSDDFYCLTSYGINHTCSITGLSQGLNSIYIACQDYTDTYPNRDSHLTNTMIVYNVTSPPNFCNDSDGGESIVIKGEVIDSQGNRYVDNCWSATSLQEFSCYNRNVNYTFYECPLGWTCEDGRCLNVTASNVFCNDTDYGNDPYVSGHVSDGTNYFSDYCYQTGDILLEYYCQDGLIMTENYSCLDYGMECKYNRCINENASTGATCNETDGGKNYLHFGGVVYGNRYYQDECYGNTLVEYFCQNGMLFHEYYQCSDVDRACLDGECIPISSNCNDTDGGVDYYLAGTAYAGNDYGADFCYEIDQDVLFEFYCENGMISGRNYTCRSGCVQGACINESNKETSFCGDNICQGGIITNMTDQTAFNYLYNNKNYSIYLVNTTFGSAEFYINAQYTIINEGEQKTIDGLSITVHTVHYAGGEGGAVLVTLGETEYTCPQDCRKWYGSFSGITTTIAQAPINFIRFLERLFGLE